MSIFVRKSLLFNYLNCVKLSRKSPLLCRHLCQHVTSGQVRVRFAPSPTGFIHLGGLRTAFYNYLFAKRHNGKFILRIEDTDRERIVPGSLKNIIDTLGWSQLIPDEGPIFGGEYGPYIQSERVQLYKEMSERLLKTNSAYRCFCPPKRLEVSERESGKHREFTKYDNRCRSLTAEEVNANLANGKPFAIRLKLKDGPLTFKDIVYGDVTHDLSKVEADPILVKSNGLPTYHFANVVDDHLMQITHVIRGYEWLDSTPKHMMLYEAFGWRAPAFGHLPLVLNTDGSKLSKRNDHIRMDSFREAGYYPEAIINYLSHLGNGFGELDVVKSDQIYSNPQLSEAFRLETVSQHNARMDMDVIRLLNRHVLKDLCQSDMTRLVNELRQLLMKHLKETQHIQEDEYIRRIIEYSLDRIYTLKDLIGNDFLYLWSVPKFNWSPSSIASNQTVKSALQETIDTLRPLTGDEYRQSALVLAKLKELHQNSSTRTSTLKFGTFMRLLRLALANIKQGSPVTEILQLLGQKRSIEYLESAREYVDSIEESKKIDIDCQ